MPEIVEKHRGVLPHYQEQNQIISLTWRLAFTLPAHLQKILDQMNDIQELKRFDLSQAESLEKKYYILSLIYDKHLGLYQSNEVNLCEPKAAPIIAGAIHFYDTKLYLLHAYCLMPNHLHILLQPLPKSGTGFNKISEISRKIKSYTANQLNSLLHREGALWQHEYFDRFIRNPADYNRTVMYILNNPLKAGLVSKPDTWPWAYFNSGLQ